MKNFIVTWLDGNGARQTCIISAKNAILAGVNSLLYCKVPSSDAIVSIKLTTEL